MFTYSFWGVRGWVGCGGVFGWGVHVWLGVVVGFFYKLVLFFVLVFGCRCVNSWGRVGVFIAAVFISVYREGFFVWWLFFFLIRLYHFVLVFGGFFHVCINFVGFWWGFFSKFASFFALVLVRMVGIFCELVSFLVLLLVGGVCLFLWEMLVPFWSLRVYNPSLHSRCGVQ